ncbi:hypothetical protein C0995_016133 [Termitomyces sp. Mi166|nr:hypothetical protein C0995_016133 [Termitomyces sp. Mi166\
MDLDTDFNTLDLVGSTPPVDSLIEKVLEVYRAVWNEFYTWEKDYCDNQIDGCERPVGHPSPGLPNHVDHVPPEFHLKPPKDGSLEHFTVEHFDAFKNPERYSTMYCPDTIKDARQPCGYPRYEFCTPAAHNEVKVDPHGGALAFIPYADDEEFKIDEYLSHVHRVSWQSDFPDPDWELIELEVMTRLVVHWKFTLQEVDQLQILRKSRINPTSGLLWDTSQR